MRLFVALVPPTSVLNDLDDFVAPRREAARDSGLRWTDRHQWHVTLAFMPDVSERALDDLTERLTRAAARRHPLNLAVVGAGTFPNPAKAKVLWAGIEGDVEHVRQLAVGTRAAATKAGAAAEGGPFHPHLTLARTGRPFDVTKWLRVFEGYRGPGWRADAISLIESHLGEGPRGKPRYDVVGEFSLGRPGEQE